MQLLKIFLDINYLNKKDLRKNFYNPFIRTKNRLFVKKIFSVLKKTALP